MLCFKELESLHVREITIDVRYSIIFRLSLSDNRKHEHRLLPVDYKHISYFPFKAISNIYGFWYQWTRVMWLCCWFDGSWYVQNKHEFKGNIYLIERRFDEDIFCKWLVCCHSMYFDWGTLYSRSTCHWSTIDWTVPTKGYIQCPNHSSPIKAPKFDATTSLLSRAWVIPEWVSVFLSFSVSLVLYFCRRY